MTVVGGATSVGIGLCVVREWLSVTPARRSFTPCSSGEGVLLTVTSLFVTPALAIGFDQPLDHVHSPLVKFRRLSKFSSPDIFRNVAGLFVSLDVIANFPVAVE